MRGANLATTVVFVGLALLVASSFGWLAWPARWIFAVAFVLAIPPTVLRVRSAKKRRRASYAVDWLERAEARTQDTFDFGQIDGAEYTERDHEYAYDLDLFGAHSVFERLNACHTALGRDALHTLLLDTNRVSDLSIPQSAVRELVTSVDEREALEVNLRAMLDRAGRRRDSLAEQTRGLVQWARGPSPDALPAWIRNASAIMPFVAMAGIAVWLGLGWPWWIAAAPYAVNLFISSRVKDIGPLMTVFEGVRSTLAPWADTVRTVSAFRFQSAPLADTIGRLGQDNAPATIRRLGSLADQLSQRRNAVWALTGNVVLLSDVRARNALAGWHRQHGEQLANWMEAVAQLEAWAALASYAESFSSPTWPEAASDGPMVEAIGIAHPLLPTATRVGNDGLLREAGATWVVTGSNMGGKSTFLRALGLGVVFARMGLPVSAERLRIRNLHVVTSMKVEESLHSGSSRFHAEVRRLRQCLDWAAEGPSLVLLDEILGGTNSAERRIGTVAVLERLRSLGAVTLVSTHDLGLSDVLDEWTSETRVVHFTDHIKDGKMVFDYRVKEGRLPSTNALEVMRAEGIPVD